VFERKRRKQKKRNKRKKDRGSFFGAMSLYPVGERVEMMVMMTFGSGVAALRASGAPRTRLRAP